MQLTPKKIFLIDSLGAAITALTIGVVLVQFQAHIGMPTSILHRLAWVAVGLTLYSGLCYYLMPHKWQILMKIVALANLAYCGLTLGLVIYLWQSLQGLGITYFLLEIAVIVALATVELRTAYRHKH
jgi:hypothetical protein